MIAEQDMYRAHLAFGDEHPEWAQRALSVINEWGRAERTLAHAIGEALIEAHRMGAAGESPVYEAPIVQKMVRRSRAVPEPEPVQQKFLRRRR